MKYTIGIDLGVADIGWSIFNNETGSIEKSGVRTFSQTNGAKDRRIIRNTRRRMKRRDNRENDIQELLKKIDFPIHKIIDSELIKTRVKSLKEKVDKQDITNILLFISANRGYIPFGDEEANYIDLEGKYPCEYYLESLLKNGKFRALNNTVRNEDNIREIKDMLLFQSNYYSDLNTGFIDGVTNVIQRKRKFWEGPGSIDHKFTPYGRFKNQEDVDQYLKNKDANANYEKYIYEDLIGKCKISINERCAVNVNYYAEEFNFINDFTNIFFNNMDEIGKKELVKEENGKIKLTSEAILEIEQYILNSKSINLKKLFKDTLNTDIDNMFGNRVNKKGEMEFSLFQFYKYVKNRFVKDEQDISWLDHIEVYNKVMDYINIAPGVVELNKMLENDTTINKKFNQKELEIIKDIKEKKNSDFKYHSLSETVLKMAIKDMLKYGMNYSSVSLKLDYGKEAREYFKTNYTNKTAALPIIENKYIDDIIASPQVKKSLRQAIRIINAIIIEKQDYPYVIAIESTKEMNGNDKKLELIREQRNFEALKKDAENTLKVECGEVDASDVTIEKVMLYKETHGHCIYCNKPVSFNDLMNGIIEVDHILPRSKSFDNSFNNKTIACKDCNAKKNNKTPYSYLNSCGLYEEFSKRVKELKISQTKMSNLLLRGDIEKFSKKFINRNLRDTAYATTELIDQIKLFNRYLEGIVDDTKIKTLSTPGQLTSALRKSHKLDKDRDDGLFHHAVDASIVAAITNTDIGELIIDSQNNSKFWIDNKKIDNQINKLLNASLEKSIDSIRLISNDNIFVSSQTTKNPQGKLSNANIYKLIKKDKEYFKIDQIDNLYEFDFKKNGSKFEKMINEDDKTITLLCYDKDKKLFHLIKDIYTKYKDSNINPFVEYALEMNEIENVKDFNVLKHGIRVNNKPNAPILKTLRYYTTITEPYLLEKENINKKDNTIIALDSLAQYCTRVYYNQTKNCFAFLPIYSISVDLNTRKINEDNSFYKLFYKKYINSDNVEHIVDLFNGDFIEIKKKNERVLEGYCSGFDKKTSVIAMKMESSFNEFDQNGQKIEKKKRNLFTKSDKQFTLYTFDILGKKYKRLTYEIK